MKLVNKSKYKCLVLPKHCATEISAEQHGKIARILGLSDNLLINGIETVDIDENWVDILNLLKNKLEGVGKKLRLVNFTALLEETLMNGSFNYIQLFSIGVSEALQDFKFKSEQESKGNFLKAFIQTAPRVLYIQAQTLCKQKKISVKKGDISILPGEISGIVKVVSPQSYYAIILCFPKETFLKIMSRMLGDTFTELNKDIQDGAAEFLSIIYGQVRAQLREESSGFQASIPTVFVGNKLSSLEFVDKGTIAVESGKMVTIPFETLLGNFYIEAWLPKEFNGSFLG